VILDAGEDVAEEGCLGNIVEVKKTKKIRNSISIGIDVGSFTRGGFGLPKHQTGQVGVDLRNTPSQLVGIAPFSDFVLGQNIHASDVGSDQKRAHRGVDKDFHGEVSGLWLSRDSSQVENAESGKAGEGDLEKGFISQQYSAWS
jgi:hypothetical protein